MRNAGLDETQAGIKITRRNFNNLRCADDTTLMAESKEELKSLLMKVKEESKKVGLKLSVQKTKIMESGSITSWEIDGETVETVSDFILGGSKITADGDCSHEVKRHLLLGRKVMTNLDSILKSRDITLPPKVCLVKAMVFPVVMYGCESCTIKKAERQRIDAFELWCWRRLLRVPWTARRSNQSILKEISPEYSLKGLMLKLKPNTLATSCEELTHLKRPWCWERLKAGGDGWMASPTRWTWVCVNSGSWWWIGKPGVLQSIGLQRVGHHWVTELNWFCIKRLPTQLQSTEGWSFLVFFLFVFSFFFNIPFSSLLFSLCFGYIVSIRLTVSVDYTLRSLQFPTNSALQRGLECCQ